MIQWKLISGSGFIELKSKSARCSWAIIHSDCQIRVPSRAQLLRRSAIWSAHQIFINTRVGVADFDQNDVGPGDFHWNYTTRTGSGIFQMRSIKKFRFVEFQHTKKILDQVFFFLWVQSNNLVISADGATNSIVKKLQMLNYSIIIKYSCGEFLFPHTLGKQLLFIICQKFYYAFDTACLMTKYQSSFVSVDVFWFNYTKRILFSRYLFFCYVIGFVDRYTLVFVESVKLYNYVLCWSFTQSGL